MEVIRLLRRLDPNTTRIQQEVITSLLYFSQAMLVVMVTSNSFTLREAGI